MNFKGQILAQADLTVTTLTDVYTVPDGKSAFVAINVDNRNNSGVKIRIAVAIAGEANSNKQYIAYDVAVSANESFEKGQFPRDGIPLRSRDVIRVYTDTANVSVNVMGVEY